MESKKWFHSKKLAAALATVLVVLVNGVFDLQLPVEETVTVVGALILYIFVEAGLDAKREKGSYHPIQDPAVRDALESLITDSYDYSMARIDGINSHIQHVKGKVFDGLQQLGISPKLLDESEEFAKEISRIVIKLYREDQKMQEGADLVLGKSTNNKKQ